MRVLITGGAGYIGSHACLRLLELGHDVTVLDDLSNSTEGALVRVQELARRPLRFVKGDVRNPKCLAEALDYGVEAVIHFAALKSVSDSTVQPIKYYDVNVGGTVSLIKAMSKAGVKRLIYSSSASIYGGASFSPVRESSCLHPESPYARTKMVGERLIEDWAASNKSISAVLLRYFNPVGAHGSGRIGESPVGEPMNLVPYVAQVAMGLRRVLRVFGNDYPTPDGTGVRDYIHVMDVAEAHLRALDYGGMVAGVEVMNLGTGKGYSVLEVLRVFESVCGRSIPYEIHPRRPGDVAELVADPGKANVLLQWHAKSDLRQMCEDAWRWQLSLASGPLGSADKNAT